MRRDFYFFGILFLSLYVIGAVFQSILIFLIEYEVYRLNSFPNWFLVVAGTALIGFIYALKYYQFQGYRAVFITGMIVIIASLCQSILFYGYVLRFIVELQQYYIFAAFFTLGASLLYAITLIFSKAGHNPWLKAMGIYAFVMAGLSAYLLILSLQAMPLPVNDTVVQISKWAHLGVSLEFIPLIILFYGKYNSFKADHEDYIRRKSSDFIYALGGIALLMLLVFGVKIYTQTYYKSHVSPYARTLAEPFEARTYTNSAGDNLLYRLLKPQDYDPGQAYPLVVCLHGGAGWGTDNFRNIEGSLFARELSKPINQQRYPAFLFVPQCPPRASWGGLPNFPDIDSLVFEAINALEQEFAIDTHRVYVAGHSLGGYGAWHFIGTRPDMFAAAIPVAGVGNPALAPNMLDVAIWAFHGANDRNVPVSGSRDVIAAIQEAGGDPRYTESPDGGHGWEIVTETPGVFEWLFTQKGD